MMQFILKGVQEDGQNKHINGFQEMELLQKLNIHMLANNKPNALNLQELSNHLYLT